MKRKYGRVKTTQLALALSVLFLLPGLTQAKTTTDNYQLQQVLIFSRHNLRAPLANNGSVLEQATAQSWPAWDVAGGELTPRGGVLEVYMGRFMREWLAQQKLLPADKCPAKGDVYTWANSLQRTVATAQFFVTGAFPGCDIAVYHQPNMGTMDPTFHPAFVDMTPERSAQAIKAMEHQRQHYPLTKSYQLLEKIIHYQNSPDCKEKQHCDLVSGKDTFTAKSGDEPQVSGPLKIGNSLVDAFTLQYYQGFPLDQVAWGQIKTDQQWRLLSLIKNSYQNTLFTSPKVARQLAAPLVRYIRQTLITNPDQSAKLTVMVGHDSNIASLLAAIGVTPYQLPGQYESTPIGGQVVFERWLDTKNHQHLYKVEYIYQSSEQLRNLTPLSLRHPAQQVTLHLQGCPTDNQGFCPSDKFAAAFNQALK